MPRAKRPLAEADPNASTASSRGRKSAKTIDSKPVVEKGPQILSGNLLVQKYQETIIKLAPKHGEQIDYKSKDSSKLRRLLSERYLCSDGTRDEMIQRLESSSIDYEYLESGKISEMLRSRHVKYASQGSKQLKIQRLRLNDQLEYDTGTPGDSFHYGRFQAIEEALNDALARHSETELRPYSGRVAGKNYPSLQVAKLCKALDDRGLPTTGTREDLIARLLKDDRKKSEARIRDLKARHKELKGGLETLRGRPVTAEEVERVFGSHTAEIERLDDELRLCHPTALGSVSHCEDDLKELKGVERVEKT